MACNMDISMLHAIAFVRNQVTGIPNTKTFRVPLNPLHEIFSCRKFSEIFEREGEKFDCSLHRKCHFERCLFPVYTEDCRVSNFPNFRHSP